MIIRDPAGLVALTALLTLGGCSSADTTGTTGGAPAATPSYYRDVKPIVDVKCAGCHVEGGIAPFSLTTFDEVAAQRAAVKSSIMTGSMPPWPPATDCADYLGDRSLTADQIATLSAWVDAGGPAGDPAAQPAAIKDTRTRLSRVDRTLSLPVAYTPQTSPDDYRCFLVDWPDTDTTYVTGVGVEPGTPAIVHHVIAFLAKPAEVAGYQALDDAEAGPGWTCFGGPGGVGLATWVGAWAPGSLGSDLPPGTGIEIPAGSRMVIQVHYNTSTSPPAPDQSSVLLKLDKSVEKKAVTMPWADPGWVKNKTMDIPAQSKDTMHSFSIDPTPYANLFTGGVLAPGAPFTLHSASLHMHTHGTRAVTRIERAGGGEECLLDIERWNFHWQGAYAFDAPKTLNPGDKLTLECHWDNPGPTAMNWGEGTDDEMCLGVYYATQ